MVIQRLIIASLFFLIPFYAYAGQFYMGPSLVLLVNSISDTDYAGVGPKMTLGYKTFLTPQFLLSYELYGQFNSLSITPDENNFLKISRSFGLSVLPGYQFNNSTFVYGRLGAVLTQFNSTPYTQGAQIGLGLQKKLTDHWDIRSEYSYTTYNSVNRNDNDEFDNTLNSPHTNAFSIGFIRNFG